MKETYRTTLTNNELLTALEGFGMLDQLLRAVTPKLYAVDTEPKQPPLQPQLARQLVVCRMLRLYKVLLRIVELLEGGQEQEWTDVVETAREGLGPLGPIESTEDFVRRLDEDVEAFFFDVKDLCDLANMKQERIDRIRKDVTLTADDLLDAESKYKTRDEQAKHLGVSTRHLRKLRKRLLQ